MEMKIIEVYLRRRNAGARRGLSGIRRATAAWAFVLIMAIVHARLIAEGCPGAAGIVRIGMIIAGETHPIIYFPSQIERVPEGERFKYCPVCGRPLTKEDFKSVPSS